MAQEQDIQEAADQHYSSRFEEISRLLALADQANNLGHYEWQEQMQERLEEIPLSVECVAIYPRREQMEWEILLGTGGPADRVLVLTDWDGNVEQATYQHQDWFTPWTDARNQDSDTVEAFASAFYFSHLQDVIERI